MNRIHRNLMHELRRRTPPALDPHVEPGDEHSLDPRVEPGDEQGLRSDPESDLRLDALELRDAILGDGVVLNEESDGELLLHAVAGGRVRPLGRFGGAAAAWRAVDELDDPLGAEVLPPRLLPLEC